MYAQQLNYCCSVVEIGDFDDDAPYGKETKQDIFNTIFEYLKDSHDDWTGSIEKEIPHVYIATTTKDQPKAAIALREAGFKERTMRGRHAKNNKDKYLSFWIRTSIPREVRKMIRVHNKEVKDNDY